jgi:selenocysteine-specific elongation factor
MVRINDSIHLYKDVIEKIKDDLTLYLTGKKEIAMSAFRDLAKTSRKFAAPFMEYFDSRKVTQRIGDKRFLRGCCAFPASRSS